MKIEIWVDFVCPFCYMGETKFEMALAQFEHKDEVELVFRSYELNMATQNVKGKDIHQVIADKYHISYQEAKANNGQITKAAAEVGLHYRFDILKLNNTRLAHEIAQYAKEVGKADELTKRFFQEYFEEGLDIGDKEKLFAIAVEIGLDLNELQMQLESGQLTKKVQQDEALAQQLGINGVPYFLIDNKYAVSGAQSPEYFLKALRQVYEKKTI